MLVDWMMEVCDDFSLNRQTFHLSIFLVDKYLSQERNFCLDYFQLLGVAALYSASKIEEIYPPNIKSFEQSTDSGFTTN
jgi:cyclin E